MVIDDQDGQLHQTSVASPATARTRANPCFTQPTGDSPMTTARRAGWRPGPGYPTVHDSDRTIRHGHISRCMRARHWRRPRTGGQGDMLHRCPRTLPDAHPGDHAGRRPAPGSTPSARHRAGHAARRSPAPLAPPTSPTPESAHMAVRPWPIGRPAASSRRFVSESRCFLRHALYSAELENWREISADLWGCQLVCVGAAR